MSDPFRLALTLFLVPFFLVGAYFRIRSKTPEKLDRLQEGLPILISLRLCGIATWAAVFVWLVRPGAFGWGGVDLPPAVRWFGVPILIGGALWLAWVFRSLGPNLTDTVVTRRNAFIVVAGPYRWIRHPMYATVAPLGIGMSLLTANWLFAGLTAAVFALLWIRTAREERNLLARFGESYRAYMQSTGRFFPKMI